MPDTSAHRRPSARHRSFAVIALLAVLVLALGACGSSSTGSSSGATNSASATKTGNPRSGRFTALRTCLQKEGITLPSRPSGALPRRGGFKLPEGLSRAKFQEAIKKCGGGFPRGARLGFGVARARAALSKYAECMRANGVKLPAPNTSGKGPVFDTTGIDTASATFKTAQTKCRGELKGAFGAGGPPAGGPPPAGVAGGPPPGGYGGPPPASEAEGG